MAAKSKKPAKGVSNKAKEIKFQVHQKQLDFIQCKADEVLFGGAAGGGKSFSQLIDAFYMASEYPGIKQLILRESFPELTRSLIMVSLSMYPQEFGKYNGSEHKWYAHNGSIIEFGYLENDADVQIYQSAEYDVIRIDESTHFSEYRIMYMKSRIRGANDFPKQLKMSTNPGGPGHKFLKTRFKIGVTPPNETFREFIGTDEKGKDFYETRCFIPSRVYDNQFLMAADPNYIKNLLQLPEKERKQLLEGDWDTFEDQAFPEFKYEIHVCKRFPIPSHWRKWRSADNGYTDPFAWYWHAVDEQGNVYTYREYTRRHKDPKITYSEQAKRVVEMSEIPEIRDGEARIRKEKINYTVVGHDAFNSHPLSEQGKSIIDYYAEGGVHGCVRAITDRRLRKAVAHEYLKPYLDENTGKWTAKWKIFNTCKCLIEDLPDMIQDPKDVEKYADHEFDHTVDSALYGILSYHANKSKLLKSDRTPMQKDMDRVFKQMKMGGKMSARRFM
jgi:hypothetical protein